MKPALIVILALLLAVGMVACRSGENPPPPVSPTTTVPTVTAPPTTTPAVEKVTVLAEAHSPYGVDARYDITGTPEADSLLAVLAAPDVCHHGHNPTMGGALIFRVMQNAAESACFTSDCSEFLPVVIQDPYTAYHLAQDISMNVRSKYLSLPQASIDHITVRYYGQEERAFHCEDAATISAVQGYIDGMTGYGTLVTRDEMSEAARQGDIYFLRYKDNLLYEYTIRPTKPGVEAGRVCIAIGFLQAGNPWYEIEADILPLLTNL